MEKPQFFNQETGRYEDCVPEPFFYGFIPWLWLRLTGWRDEHGRKAQLLNDPIFEDQDD